MRHILLNFSSAAIILLSAVSCSTGNHSVAKQQQQQPISENQAWYQIMDTAGRAFRQGHYDVALSTYQRAYTLALMQDNTVALAQTGYNLAACWLALDRPDEALRLVDELRKAMALRNSGLPYDIALIEGASFYRMGQYIPALQSASRIMQGVQDQNIAARAALLQALAADRLNNEQMVSASATYLNNMRGPLTLSQQADRYEVDAMALERVNPQQGEIQAENAVNIRRKDGAYRDMIRALNLASQLASSSGQVDKARSLAMQAQQSSHSLDASIVKMDGDGSAQKARPSL